MSKLIEYISEEELNKIIELYKNNYSLRQIEKEVHHGRRAISKMLEDLNIKTVKGNHYRKYFFDFDFFEKIDTEIKAYWLGFLYADGCITTQTKYGEQGFKLALAKQDEEILIKFKDDLRSTYPIRYDYSKNRKNPNHQVQVICSYIKQKTVNDLKRLGCVENKSLILEFPTEEQVPYYLIRHFIRGYFDGDGSISNYKGRYVLNIVGTQNFINKLFTYFNNGSVYPDKRKVNSWYFSISSNKQVIEAYHYMYDNSTRYLKRKYDKFQPLLLKYSEN